ncbi:MAG: hypothetical protein ACTSPX_03160 [Candidatus Thorarchaeota archaeon]
MKFCPLIKDACKRHECAWFLSDRICAIARIAVRLDVFVEGVPVVKLFKEEEPSGEVDAE